MGQGPLAGTAGGFPCIPSVLVRRDALLSCHCAAAKQLERSIDSVVCFRVQVLSLGREIVIPTAEFKAIFDRVKLDADAFTPENFKPGTSGQADLYRKLQADTKLDESSIWKGATGTTRGEYG